MTNHEMKEVVYKQPIGVSIFSVGMLQAYSHGILTEEYLDCSQPDREANHGVVIVGWGKVQPDDHVKGKCNEYWVVRNSWGYSWGEKGFFRLCMDEKNDPRYPYGTCLIN